MSCFARPKKKYSNSRVVGKNNSERNKKPYTPLQVKWSVPYQLYYSYLFCRNKKIPLWSLFLIVYLHLQWNAVLTQIMLCLAEAVLRNRRFFCVNPIEPLLER
jgi:hypothetical protein